MSKSQFGVSSGAKRSSAMLVVLSVFLLFTGCAAIKNFLFPPLPGEPFTDPRDEKVYRAVKIGNLTWMADNLNFTTNESWCYNNNPSNCEKFGRLYSWNAAKTACPAGWRLATNGDWENLIAAAGDGKDARYNLTSKTVDEFSTDKFGFSALMGGWRDADGGDYRDINGYGWWWSATDGGEAIATSWGVQPGQYSIVQASHGSRKEGGCSVRCVKE